jgi:RHH-type proline utilization regulon transcriptional repressor/proline dehydrogenase/delta 1-pyrroline-5-carboxylate dehydrogenase
VRRLLENGANTSFVNRIADDNISLSDLVQDPVQQIEQMAAREGPGPAPSAHPPAPRSLRRGAPEPAGLDLANEHRLGSLSAALLASTNTAWQASPCWAATPRRRPSSSPCSTRPITAMSSVR